MIKIGIQTKKQIWDKNLLYELKYIREELLWNLEGNMEQCPRMGTPIENEKESEGLAMEIVITACMEGN